MSLIVCEGGEGEEKKREEGRKEEMVEGK